MGCVEHGATLQRRDKSLEHYDTQGSARATTSECSATSPLSYNIYAVSPIYLTSPPLLPPALPNTLASRRVLGRHSDQPMRGPDRRRAPPLAPRPSPHIAPPHAARLNQSTPIGRQVREVDAPDLGVATKCAPQANRASASFCKGTLAVSVLWVKPRQTPRKERKRHKAAGTTGRTYLARFLLWLYLRRHRLSVWRRLRWRCGGAELPRAPTTSHVPWPNCNRRRRQIEVYTT
mmetsp:Transcript_34495/g.80639  ORF Transcript_34495/g.80639 Transcript_34495/m.80639 type:complete len:233 (-) Transcript_34495:51-749(-)